MIYFLDTNICIYLLKGTSYSLTSRLLDTRPTDVKIPSIVYGELLAGAKVSGAPEKSFKAVQSFIAQFDVIPFDKACAEAYGRIRASLLASGKGGANDMIIAATALSRGGIVVTNDEKDFARFTDIATENWTKQDF